MRPLRALGAILALPAAAPAPGQGLNFGDNSSQCANDGECDDIRFEGLAMASVVGPDQVRREASGYRAGCQMVIVALRAYSQ